MSDAKTEVVDLVDLDDEGKQPPKYHQVAENCYEILDTDDDEDGEDDDRKMPAVATKRDLLQLLCLKPVNCSKNPRRRR